MSDFLGLISAYALIGTAILIAGLLLNRGIFSATLARKFIHIGVSHWWLIAMSFHRGAAVAAVGPITFIVFNYVAHRRQLLAVMSDPEQRYNLGTVYYPISLLLLVVLCFGGPIPLYVGGIGVLVMGWGDGLASLVGKRWGRPFAGFAGRHKSLAGSIAMLSASTLVVALFMLRFHPAATAAPFVVGASLATAAVATLIELATPFGLDNITVPLSTTLFFHLVFA